MNENNYSSMLRALSKEYYQNHISFTEYRERRTVILEDIDAEYNGYHPEQESSDSGGSSILSKAVDLFKGTDSDE
jgi:hypothetical protein